MLSELLQPWMQDFPDSLQGRQLLDLLCERHTLGS